MKAGEPCLLQISIPARRAGEKAGREWLALLVNRQRLECVRDVGIQSDVVILVLVPVEYLADRAGGPQCADGIPDTDEENGRAGSRCTDIAKCVLPFR